MTLGQIIKLLEAAPQNLVVKCGLGSPHSDRGSYVNLGFTPTENITVAEMLANAKSAIGQTFTGWKGGDFLMDENTDCFIGDWGECGEDIDECLMDRMLGLTAQRDYEICKAFVDRFRERYNDHHLEAYNEDGYSIHDAIMNELTSMQDALPTNPKGKTNDNLS